MQIRFIPTLWRRASLALVSAGSLFAASATVEKIYFRLAADAAELTLKRFSEQSGRQVIAPTSLLEGVRTQRVEGEFTSREALQRMFALTSLRVSGDERTGAFALVGAAVAPAPKKKAPRAIDAGEGADGAATDASTLSPNPMKPHLPLRPRSWLAALLAPVLHAQTPALPANPRPDSETVMLDTFTITASDTAGYRATNSVSGTLIKTALEKLPIAIQVVTDEFIKDLAVFTVEDAIRYTSGIGLTARNEGPTTREIFSIRGYPTSLILRNGVPLNTATDTAAIERIEVVKGPSGVLFGASDPGGLINYVTKQPLPKRFLRVRQTVASYDRLRTEIDLNQPLDRAGTLRFRLPASFSSEDSWLRYADMERLFLNPVVAWSPRPDTRLTVESTYHQQNGNFRRAGTPFRAGFVGNVLPQDMVDGADNSTLLAPNQTYRARTKTVAARLDKAFSDSLAFQAVYEITDLNSDQFLTLNNGPTLQAAPPYTLRSYSASEYAGSASKIMQVSLVKSLDWRWSKHKILLGARRVENGSRSVIYRASTENPVIAVTNPNPDPAVQYFTRARDTFDPLVNAGVVLGRDYSLLSGSAAYANAPYAWSAFVTDQVSLLSERLLLLGGVRYDRLRSTRQTRYTPQFGVNYTVRPGLTAYGLYSESFRENGRSDSRDPNSSFFPPEQGTGYEAGFKLNLMDERLSGSIALFKIIRSNVVVVDGSQVVLGRNTRSLAGEQTSEGVEVDLVYTPTRSLSAILAYAHTNARTTKDKIADLSPDTNRDGIPDSIGLLNEGVAKNSASLWLRYRFLAGGLKNVGLGVGGQWRQGPIQQFPTGNRALMIQPDDTNRFDAVATYKLTFQARPVNLQLNVQNFTNERYWDRRVQFNAPRIYQLTVGTEF